MFDKLLLPQNVLPQNVLPIPELGKGNAKRSKRHVVDLPSWLEAWNRYICVGLAYDHYMALGLIKIMVKLFPNHSSACCLEYAGSARQLHVI